VVVMVVFFSSTITTTTGTHVMDGRKKVGNPKLDI
jgi:hypothetical protein